jgi:hypothetical protein
MLYSPEKKKKIIKTRTPAIMLIKIHLNQMAAHSVLADPSPSHPIGLFFIVLLHVVPSFAGHRLLISSLSGGPGPPSPPPPILTLFLSDPRQQPASLSGTLSTTEKGRKSFWCPPLRAG